MNPLTFIAVIVEIKNLHAEMHREASVEHSRFLFSSLDYSRSERPTFPYDHLENRFSFRRGL